MPENERAIWLKKIPFSNSTTVGLVLTAVWVLIILLLIVRYHNTLSSLNEWGDFLAGMVGPLALLWLVLGYFQQQRELRQNTEALNLQRQELEKTAKEQARLATNSTAQVELLVSPFVAVRLGDSSNRNGKYFREAWAQNIGATAAYFGHTPKGITFLKNSLSEGFWCAGDEHYFEAGVMEDKIGQLSIELYNRSGDLVLNIIQFERGENGVPKSARLVANRTLQGVSSVNVDSVDV